MRPQRVILGLLVVSLVTSGIGFVVGSRMKSSADAAAEREPPTASPVTVEVERRVLTSVVTLRGTIAYPNPQSAELGGLVGGLAERQVITVAPAKGASVDDGSVVAQVSGRPVIAVQGAQPSYRALGPGSAGADVEQLEAALVRYGFDPGVVDGAFTESTSQAVIAWYGALGFAVEGGGSPAATSVAAGEIMFVPELPVRVIEVVAPVGTTVAGSIFNFTGGDLEVAAVATRQDRELLQVNQEAEIDGPGIEMTGTVQSIDPLEGDFEIRITAPTLDTNVEAAAVRVRLSVAASDGAVLAVPVVAISSRADGEEYVVVVERGKRRQVAVRTGLVAGGLVEIAPVEASAVDVGNQIVVGRW